MKWLLRGGAVVVVVYAIAAGGVLLAMMQAEAGKSDELVSVLNDHTIVAAIGPVCAAALRALGITPDVQPAHPKMGALIAALADYVELSGRSRRETHI